MRGEELEILCEGGRRLPNGGTAILEGGVLTLDETMLGIAKVWVCIGLGLPVII